MLGSPPADGHARGAAKKSQLPLHHGFLGDLPACLRRTIRIFAIVGCSAAPKRAASIALAVSPACFYLASRWPGSCFDSAVLT
jgi:hypothetical protein